MERVRVDFEWDYGYRLPLRSVEHVESRLSADLLTDLRSWLDAMEASNPSRPDGLAGAWVSAGRRLCARVQAELGPDYEVVFELDRPSGR